MVEKRKGEALQVIEHLRTHIEHDTLPHHVQDVYVQVAQRHPHAQDEQVDARDEQQAIASRA